MVSPKGKTSQKMLIDEVNNTSKKIKKQKRYSLALTNEYLFCI